MQRSSPRLLRYVTKTARSFRAVVNKQLFAGEALENRFLMTVYYVDTGNASASDSNAGTSISQPLKTINQALALATYNNSISQADTILIRGGVYHEQPNTWTADSGTSPNDRTIVSAYVNPTTGKYEPVYIDAADPTTGTWTRDGTSDRWFLNNFTTQTAGVWMDWSPSNDGASLQQIGGYNGETTSYRAITGNGIADMVPGSYFGDIAHSRLYIWLTDGSDPDSHVIEYANRSRAIYQPGTPAGSGYSYANYVDFKGLNLRHANVYNTIGQDPGCGIYTEGDQRLIDCDIQWNTEDGVHLLGTSQMINCVASNNGGNGVAAKGNGFSITGGQYNLNYWRHYNDGSNAAIKVITSNPTIYGNIEGIESAYNYGKGIWYDTCFENNVISNVTGNYIHDNEDSGIDLEASRNFLVANNIIIGNHAGGITLNAVENAAIYNNTIIGNYGVSAIELDGGTRDQGSIYPGTVGMLNNRITNNIIDNNFTDYDLDVPVLAEPSLEVAGNVSDYNLFYRRGGPLKFATGGTYLGSWGITPSSINGWQAASGLDIHSKVADPLFQVGGSGSLAYSLGADSPARQGGADLSSQLSTDFRGTLRSIGPFDSGAIEYSGGGNGSPGPIVTDTDPANWLDDQLPDNAGMTVPDQYNNAMENRFWLWDSNNAYSGAASLDSTVAAGSHRQYFAGSNPRTVAADDALSAYVWLDPAHLPSEIMFEWQDSAGSWNHQAYWGQNVFGPGIDGSSNQQFIGSLPAAGQWVKLSVSASMVALAGKQITGFSFDLYNGRALLDKLGNGSTTGTISGSVYQDNNGDGIQSAGEAGLANRTVFLDLNNDGTDHQGDPTTVTDSTGAYSFTNLSTGSYTVRQIVPTGFTASTSGGESVSVAVTSGISMAAHLGEFPTLFTAASDADTLTIARSFDSLRVNIWQDVPESSLPTYSIAATQLPGIQFGAGGFNSQFIADFVNGSPLPSGALSILGGSSPHGTLTIIDASSSGHSFISSDSSVSVDSSVIHLNNLASLTLTGGSGADSFTQLAVTLPVVFNGAGGADTLNIDTGTYVLPPDPLSFLTTVNVSAGASLLIGSGYSSGSPNVYLLDTLNISPGGLVKFLPHPGSVISSLLVLNNLNLNPQSESSLGTFDIGNNQALIRNGSLTAVSNLIGAGYGNGTWNGPFGIVSSSAESDSAHLTSIGYAGGLNMTINGQVLNPSDVLIRYTYAGDTNLDGVVDGSDYTRLDNGFLNQATGWSNGDLNYDGAIDGSDFTLVDDTFNVQGVKVASQIAGTVLSPAAPGRLMHAVSSVSPATPVLLQSFVSPPGVSAILNSFSYIWTDLDLKQRGKLLHTHVLAD